MSDAGALPMARWMEDLPLPALVLGADGSRIQENSAYRARFGAGGDGAADELAVALRGGRTSAIRSAMAGASREVPIACTGGAPLSACYFPIRDAEGVPAFVGMILVESREAT